MPKKVNMKRIGITFTQTNLKNYPAWFRPEELRDDISLVELSFLNPDDSLLDACDGFVLTGGIDMDPIFYAGPKDYPNRPETFCPERDIFETNVYAHAKKRKSPVLAICRGMQLVNVAEGGGMIQDLGETGNAIHRKTGDTDKRHDIRTMSGTLLHNITGLRTGSINSAHHQAIDPERLSPTLQITALSDDGIPEALEYSPGQDLGFMIGVQWHPERMIDRETNPLSFAIRKTFIDIIRKIK